MERIRAKQEKHRQSRAGRSQPQEPPDPAQQPGEYAGWRGPRISARLCHVLSVGLPACLSRAVWSPCPCRPHSQPATVCVHLRAALHAHGAARLLLCGGRPRCPRPPHASPCRLMSASPLHRAWQSRGLLPTESVVAALAGPRHRYRLSLACRAWALLSQLLPAFWMRGLALWPPLAVPPGLPLRPHPSQACSPPGPRGRLCARLPRSDAQTRKSWSPAPPRVPLVLSGVVSLLLLVPQSADPPPRAATGCTLEGRDMRASAHGSWGAKGTHTPVTGPALK